MTKDQILANIRVYRRCWEWQGELDPQGYAKGLHREAYKLWHGPIPKGMQVHHRCYNRKCVNPDHLKLVTRSMNVRLAHRKKRGQMPARDLRIATWCHDSVLVKLENAFTSRLESE